VFCVFHCAVPGIAPLFRVGVCYDPAMIERGHSRTGVAPLPSSLFFRLRLLYRHFPSRHVDEVEASKYYL
jgi:hypothetical protein